MKRGKLFEIDFQKVPELFPKLKAIWNSKNQCWVIKGYLDICDTKGVYWDTFNILIIIPESYPFCVPRVFEISKNIPRDEDWHISKEGLCCLDIDHRMMLLGSKGINIADFIASLIYPFFANQLYRINIGSYAAGEYKHGFEGVLQFYAEQLNIKNAGTAIKILDGILSRNLPSRNHTCLCGEKKYKKCHLISTEFLLQIPKERLTKDLEEFKNVVKRTKL